MLHVYTIVYERIARLQALSEALAEIRTPESRPKRVRRTDGPAGRRRRRSPPAEAFPRAARLPLDRSSKFWHFETWTIGGRPAYICQGVTQWA